MIVRLLNGDCKYCYFKKVAKYTQALPQYYSKKKFLKNKSQKD